MLKLTVIDQSPIQLGSIDKRPAIHLSLDLAQNCEDWGYSRYWLAEHHNTSFFSGPAPEILISHIASNTKTIRVGSGGIMLSHYSPYKVAEQFRMLETLYPGRIDLGIGRAPGGDQLATAALAYPNNPTHGELYSRQAHDLKCYLEGGFEENHPFKNLKVLPTSHSNKDDTKPELWMLGSSGGSAALAGHLGMGLSLGLFIGPMGQTTDITDEYKQAFKNAGHKGKPKVMIAVGGVCADTTEEAFHLASSQVYKKTLATSRGDNDPWISPEDVQKRLSNLSPVEERYYRKLMNSFIIGSPAECKEQMHKLSQYWQTDDIAILTVTHDYESRKKSYQLFAEQLLG